jgi:hypothetical protein
MRIHTFSELQARQSHLEPLVATERLTQTTKKPRCWQRLPRKRQNESSGGIAALLTRLLLRCWQQVLLRQ